MAERPSTKRKAREELSEEEEEKEEEARDEEEEEEEEEEEGEQEKDDEEEEEEEEEKNFGKPIDSKEKKKAGEQVKTYGAYSYYVSADDSITMVQWLPHAYKQGGPNWDEAKETWSLTKQSGVRDLAVLKYGVYTMVLVPEWLYQSEIFPLYKLRLDPSVRVGTLRLCEILY